MPILILFYLTGLLPALPSLLLPGESLYIGVENRLRISLNGCYATDIQVKASAGSLYKRDDSTYVIVPQQVDEEIKIKLYYKKVICDVKTIPVKRLPDIIPSFEKEQQGFIPRSALADLGRLRMVYPADYPAEMQSTIVSCSLICYNAVGQVTYQNNIRGDSLDARSLAECSKLGKGSRLVISNILVQNQRQGTQRLSVNKEMIVTE